MRAARASAMAVASGTPTPNVSAVVAPTAVPTPTSTPAAPVRMRWRAAWFEVHEPTMTGMSSWRMNVLRLSGSPFLVTCSADRTVERMTSRSSSDSSTLGSSSSMRWGVTAPAATAPDARISCTRWTEQIGVDGLLVDLLQPGRRGLVGQRRDLGQDRARDLRSGSTGLRGRARRPRPCRRCRRPWRGSPPNRTGRRARATRTGTPASSQLRSTSSTSRVRRLGTMVNSSRP